MTSVGTVLSYPIPLYANLPIEPQFYQPNYFIISAISTGTYTTITTTANMNYVIGQQVRLLLPVKYGATQLNNQQGYVISIPSANQVVVTINSNSIDPFIASPTFIPGDSTQLPQILAIGDINLGLTNASGNLNTGTFVPGSFINISPL